MIENAEASTSKLPTSKQKCTDTVTTSVTTTKHPRASISVHNCQVVLSDDDDQDTQIAQDAIDSDVSQPKGQY